MKRFDITSLITAILIFWTSLQNPVFATDLISGQAYEPQNSVHPLSERLDEVYHYKVNQNVQEMDQNKIKEKEEENSINEVAKEKRAMQIIPSSKVYETIVKNEEANKEQNKAFLKKMINSDVTRLDLRKPSGLTQIQADELLKGTGLEGLGKAFVDAEKTYHVNAYYLIAHAAWESGWGKSKISKEKNNLFGFKAYDDGPYSNAQGFATKSEGITCVAKYISENYLNENGDYYHGPHLSGMNLNYASDGSWKEGIASVMIGLAKRTKSLEEIGRV